MTGEAVRGAAFLLRDAMLDIEAGKPAPDTPVRAHGDGVKIEYDDGRAYQLRTQELVAGQGMHPQDPAAAIKALEGCEFSYVYLEPTDKLGADVPNPKSHICYGFATHVVILDDDGRVSEVYAAHDSGKVVNPISIQGQIEGGVLMGMGYALTEDWPLKDCVPQARYGTLGLFRAPEIPDIPAIYVEKDELLPVAYGGKGIGEIATIPTAPAVQNALRAVDGKLRRELPLVDSPVSRARHRGEGADGIADGLFAHNPNCICCTFGPGSIASRGLLFGAETVFRIQASEWDERMACLAETTAQFLAPERDAFSGTVHVRWCTAPFVCAACRITL